MGVTILVSTGDDGVAGPYSRAQYCNPITPGCACYFNSSSATYSSSKGAQTKNSWSGVGYFPWFPASCPYVTAVGATKLTSGTSGSEIACSSDTGGEITSGGGFSSYYAILDWQTTAVSKYFQLVKKGSVPVPASGYNPLGRGIPDVALNGFSYQTIINGFQMEGSGTSASTPLFAAMSKFATFLPSFTIGNSVF